MANEPIDPNLLVLEKQIRELRKAVNELLGFAAHWGFQPTRPKIWDPPPIGEAPNDDDEPADRPEVGDIKTINELRRP